MFDDLIGEAKQFIQNKIHKLPTITVNATNDGYWSGMAAKDMSSVAKQLYDLGTLFKANYIVTLEPYNSDSQIADLELFNLEQLTWLATSCSMSLINANTGQIQVGHHQINHVESYSTGDMDISFIETKNADIIKFAKAVKKIMFNNDGTQNVPYHYLMRLTISLFPRHARSDEVVSESWIVALQAGSIDLSASENTAFIDVPLTFTKMFPMMD